MIKYNWDINEIKETVKECFSIGATLRKLGFKSTTGTRQKIKEIIKENLIDISHFDRNKAISLFRENNVFPRWDINKLKESIKTSTNRGEVLVKMGLRKAGGNYNTIQKYIKQYNIDISHFIPPFSSYVAMVNSVKKNARKNEDIFCENSSVCRSVVRSRIIRDSLIEYKCRDCGITTIWNNKKITLQLEHINGVFNDNRLINLCWLCPNCHSQTDTYTGRNPGRWKNGAKIDRRRGSKPRPNKRRVNYEAVIKRYGELRNRVKTGKEFGISDSAVRKIVKKYGSQYDIKHKMGI